MSLWHARGCSEQERAMDDDVLDDVNAVRLPDASPAPDDEQLAGGLPDELLFELLIC